MLLCFLNTQIIFLIFLVRCAKLSTCNFVTRWPFIVLYIYKSPVNYLACLAEMFSFSNMYCFFFIKRHLGIKFDRMSLLSLIFPCCLYFFTSGQMHLGKCLTIFCQMSGGVKTYFNFRTCFKVAISPSI